MIVPGRALRRGRAWSLAALLALGLLVRLPVMPVDYRATADVAILKGWAQTLHARGLRAAYTGTTINYPPVSVYWLAGAGWVEARPAGRLAPEARDRLLTALVKLPGVAADVLTAWLIVAALGGLSPGRRLLAGALYLFNPAIWYVSAYWGQIDSVYTLFMVASVAALERGRPGLAWLACALALATKLQAVSLAPLIVAVTWLRHGPGAAAKGALIAAGAAAALAAPWLLAGREGELWAAIWPHAEPRVAVSGYNLWYLLLVGRVHDVSSLLHPLGLPFTYRGLGVGLYGVFVLAVLGLVWRRRPRSLALPAAILALGLFVLLTEVHERFMFPALALMMLAARRHGLGRHYAALSFTFLFNLVTITPFSPWLGTNLVAANPTDAVGLALKGLALACAAVNVALLAALVRRQAAAP